MALPDHSTGGLKVENYKFAYTDRTVEFARDPLLAMKMTSVQVVKEMGVDPKDATPDDLKGSVSENWGIDLTDEEAERILTYSDLYSDKYESSPFPKIPLEFALSRIVSEEYTIAAWSSHGHNGDDGVSISYHLFFFFHHLPMTLF